MGYKGFAAAAAWNGMHHRRSTSRNPRESSVRRNA